ncbi:DEAD/DEAH box helicase [Senegalia sp. (in: firmicutes)]|uniref:DEAD/DEAH box helicase n=1 Tax=Senegalia sp. (in: firmicutes) TaxID=1924098 RepID=UPI003F945F29
MNKIKFNELQLTKEIERAINEMGFEEATPIQTQAIPVIQTGADVIGQAQTGTGKTVAFGIPVLEKIDLKDKSVQTLILCPTRELAIQVSEEIKRLAKFMPGVKTLPIYGGQPIQRQIGALKKGVQIVIGTPGRVMDHMRRGTLKLQNLKVMVLDEADEMLNMGFREDIETILDETPESRQTLLFSATIPRAIMNITKKYQKNAQTIKVVHKELTVPSIEQYYIELKRKNKLEILTRLMDIYNPKLTLVFCNTKRMVDDLVVELQGRGYFADGLHGDLKQTQRDRVMNSFRNGNVDVLVATDVAARGLDVDDVEIVFNYDMPQDEEYYVHRIGRTGRAGRAGMAISFAVGKEIYKLKHIQKYTKTNIKRLQAPSVNEVEEAKTDKLLNEIKDIIENEKLTKEINYIEKLSEDEYTSIDIAAALLKMSMGRVEEKEQQSNSDSDADFGNTGAEPGMVRLFINIGKNNRVRVKDILGAIAGETGLSGEVVGKIDMYDKFTFVEVPQGNGKKVLDIMKNNTIKGKKINIEPANSK